MECGRCGATVRTEATYCEMCGALIPARRSGAPRHGLTGTAVIIVGAASMTGLAIVVGVIMLVRAIVS